VDIQLTLLSDLVSSIVPASRSDVAERVELLGRRLLLRASRHLPGGTLVYVVDTEVDVKESSDPTGASARD
jgi:hypothetical protein